MHEDRPRLTRRRLLQLGIALPLPALLAECDGATSGDQAGGGGPATASSARSCCSP
jgi:hypothetical protein